MHIFKTYLAIIFTCLGCSLLVQGQQITSSITSTSGSSFENSSSRIDWTIGELAINIYNNQSTIMHEGFHSGLLGGGPVSVSDRMVDNKMLIYPNPCKDLIYFSDAFHRAKVDKIMIYDSKISMVSTIFPGQNNINVTALRPGAYFIIFLYKNSDYSISKMLKQ